MMFEVLLSTRECVSFGSSFVVGVTQCESFRIVTILPPLFLLLLLPFIYLSSNPKRRGKVHITDSDHETSLRQVGRKEK